MADITNTAAGAIGTAHIRIEGRDKVTGAARYAGDIALEQLAHGWLVLSTIARGRVRSIDADAVLGMPGILAVLHHGNAPRLNLDFELAMFGGPIDRTIGLFQTADVPHMGWPVALVIGETAEQSREAAERLVVQYEPQDHDVNFHADRSDAYALSGFGVTADVQTGALNEALAASAVVVDEMYATPRQHHNPIEPHTATAHWHDGRLEIIDCNQGSSWVADQLVNLFSLTPGTVRVRSEHVGGGFGSKGLVKVHHVAATMATNLIKRPVRVVLTRQQMFSIVGYRSPTAHRVRLGARPDGKLEALEHRCLSVTSKLYEIPVHASTMARVMYGAPAHHTTNHVVRLDLPTPFFMRATNEAPGSFALECAMDELAVRCGIDPIELRIRNEPTQGPVSGLPFSSRELVACLREGARRFGWNERDPRPRQRRDGRWSIGTGVAAATYRVGAGPSMASVTAHSDGAYTVRISAADLGTGARTALTLIAADALKVDPERVSVLIGDSDFGPAMLAAGSTGTRSWGWAIIAAVEKLRERLASGERIPPEGVTVSADTTAAVFGLMMEGRFERHSFGAQFAEVAVDLSTGEVRVRRMLGIFAAGRIVNPLTARSQLIGGMSWGLSMALHEGAVLDRATGGVIGPDLGTYHIATHADVPTIEADWIENPDPNDPVGIKGIGEIGNVSSAAAIANAIWHATGVRCRELPITPKRILEASRQVNDAQ